MENKQTMKSIYYNPELLILGNYTKDKNKRFQITKTVGNFAIMKA